MSSPPDPASITLRDPLPASPDKFGVFDRRDYPLIRVTLGTLHDQQDFRNFLSEWDDFNLPYRNNTHPPPPGYYFMFYTQDVRGASIRYSIMMSHFVKKLKNHQRQHRQGLRGSIIIVNSRFIRGLLSIIFYLQRPVADVYLVPDQDTAYSIWDRLSKKTTPNLEYFPQVTLITRDSSINSS